MVALLLLSCLMKLVPDEQPTDEFMSCNCSFSLLSSVRSIVCLNLPSFSGGLNPWGTPNNNKRRYVCIPKKNSSNLPLFLFPRLFMALAYFFSQSVFCWGMMGEGDGWGLSTAIRCLHQIDVLDHG